MVYRSKVQTMIESEQSSQIQTILGPHRVLPGRLSVSSALFSLSLNLVTLRLRKQGMR